MMTLERGDRLFTRDLSCLKFWTLRQGTAALCIGLHDGRRQIVRIETENDVVCGMSATDGAETWIEALESCMICEVDLSGNMAQLSNDPAFLRQIFECAHRRLAQASHHAVMLGRLDSMERVCLFLVEMAHLFGIGQGGARQVHLPLSREDIADYLGLNAETVSRLLSRIKKSRIAVFNSPTDYLVPDLVALERRVPIARHSYGVAEK
jgi:CRP-like cAMP-binding protein